MQKNTDILMEIVYFCMQIDLHVSYKYICAEISYIILQEEALLKYSVQLIEKKNLVFTVLWLIYIYGI